MPKSGNYVFKKSRPGKKVSGAELVAFYEEFVRQVSGSSALKTVVPENDWKTWKLLTDKLGSKVQLVGDDLFVTNVKFLRKRHSGRRCQLHPRQSEPDRFLDRNTGRGGTGS